MKMPAYIGVFLTPQSQKELLRDFPAVYPSVHADHVTVVFKPKELDLAKFDLGQRIKIKVVGYVEDQKANAVMVTLPPEIEKHANRTPHITISTASGVSPFYSNDLIQDSTMVQRVSPKTYEGIVDTSDRNKPSAARVAAQWLKKSDLSPPLGHPGGTCKVVQRIVDEVTNLRLEKQLVDEVQSGRDLSNPAARTVYAPEKERGAWKYKLLLLPHAQYRMDLRGITVPEIRAALDNFFKVMNLERSRGDSSKWDSFKNGMKQEWLDPRTNTFFVFEAHGNEVTVITTYKPGESEDGPCEVVASVSKYALRQKALQQMMAVGGSFGVLSAYQSGPKSENKKRHGELIAELQKAGFHRIVPIKGSWEGVTERSILVPGLPPSLLFDLGRKYKQDAVIYKSKDGVVGMYYTKGTPRAEVAVDPKGDPAFEMAADPSLHSKTRNLSFQFGFLWGQSLNWDGTHPISRKQMRNVVETQLEF